MIEQIIADAKTMEADAIKAETDSQKAHEAFVKDTAEADKTAAEEDKNSAMNEQQQNQNENADLHKACDFTLNNFEVKQAALEQEMEALAQAKAVLAGSGLSFLEKRQ